MRVFGVTGWKNAGKTHLMARLVAEITARGVSVSTIKHAHHAADIDQPGRDTHRHRSAGAQEVILATPARWALMHELRGAPEPSLAELLARLLQACGAPPGDARQLAQAVERRRADDQYLLHELLLFTTANTACTAPP